MRSMRPGFQTSLIHFRRADRLRKNDLNFSASPRMTDLLLIHRHVLVVFLQRLSVFGDLNGLRIENPNRHMLTAKFNRTINWRDPSFERSLSVVAECYPHVSSFERLDGDSILFAGFRWRRIG